MRAYWDQIQSMSGDLKQPGTIFKLSSHNTISIYAVKVTNIYYKKNLLQKCTLEALSKRQTTPEEEQHYIKLEALCHCESDRNKTTT